jgi:hypothetical protein
MSSQRIGGDRRRGVAKGDDEAPTGPSPPMPVPAGTVVQFRDRALQRRRRAQLASYTRRALSQTTDPPPLDWQMAADLVNRAMGRVGDGRRE